MKKPKKMGRPLTGVGLRNFCLTIRLDEQEHQDLVNKAHKNKMGLAEYIRYLIKKSDN